MGKQWKQWQPLFWGAPKSLQMVVAAMKLKDAYSLEMRNRFKGLDLIDRMPDELWTEVHDIVQETGIKTIPRKRNAKKQNVCLRRPYK